MTANNKPFKPDLIIGVGNEFRNDDAAGIIAVRKLNTKPSGEFAVFESDGDGAELINMWSGHKNVVLIDAVSFGYSPGTIHLLRPTEEELPKETIRHSTHKFGLAEAVETSRVLNKLPEQIRIYGIEGKSFGIGQDVSEEVKNAIDKVVEEIQNDLKT